jgi:hypothetical protein
MKTDRDYFAHKALVQAIVTAKSDNAKAIEDAFKASTNAFYPYMEEVKENKDKKAKDRLFHEMKKGVIQVTTLPTPVQAGKMFRRRRVK